MLEVNVKVTSWLKCVVGRWRRHPRRRWGVKVHLVYVSRCDEVSVMMMMMIIIIIYYILFVYYYYYYDNNNIL